MPPSQVMLSSAASCSRTSAAAHTSPTTKQSNPRSLASRRVLCTQTSVVTPATNRFLTPARRSSSSRSVCAKAPRPGLSIIGSVRASGYVDVDISESCNDCSKGWSSGIVACPSSPRMRRRPRGPRSPMPRPDGLARERCSSRVERVERSGLWPDEGRRGVSAV